MNDKNSLRFSSAYNYTNGLYKVNCDAVFRSEDVSKLIPKWEPWWLHVCSKKVQEVEESELYKLKCPEIKELIKDFSNISVSRSVHICTTIFP